MRSCCRMKLRYHGTREVRNQLESLIPSLSSCSVATDTAAAGCTALSVRPALAPPQMTGKRWKNPSRGEIRWSMVFPG